MTDSLISPPPHNQPKTMPWHLDHINAPVTVTIVGAAGRVGLPFAVAVASEALDTDVYGLDINKTLVDELNKGKTSVQEEGYYNQSFNETLNISLFQKKNLYFTTDPKVIAYSNVIVIMIGTPVDEEGNPRLDPLIKLFDENIIENMKQYHQRGFYLGWKPQVIILRSTVAPGTTEVLIKRIFEKSGFKNDKDYIISFCPERAAQGKSLPESITNTQLIGCDNPKSFQVVKKFFQSFMAKSSGFPQLSFKGAELGKLMTNMYRYVNFALANEFLMICQSHDEDYEKIRQAINLEYPRMHLEKAGPNVGGPCLFKDGKFLVQDVPYTDLIQSSFLINEGMPNFIVSILKTKTHGNIGKVCILGATFKKDNDDTRNSLSFKLKKVLHNQGSDVIIYDPLWEGNTTKLADIKQCDVIVVMTPHSAFNESVIWNHFRPGVLVVDLWKHLLITLHIKNGIYWYVRGNS